jgi:hypothetical protein
MEKGLFLEAGLISEERYLKGPYYDLVNLSVEHHAHSSGK